MAAEGRAVHAPRSGDDPGDRQRRHRLRHPRSAPGPHRDHHLPRLRRRVVGAVAVRRAGGSRRHVSRPPTARASADVRPAAHRRRLRRGQGGRDRLDPVRVLVPPAGRALRRQHARQRQRARLPHRSPRRPVEGAARGDPPRRVLRRHRCRDRLAHRSPDRGRRGGDRAVPRHVDLVGHHRRRGLRDRRRLARRPDQRAGVAVVPARPRVPRPRRSRRRRSPGSTTAACSPSRRTSSCSSLASACCCAATDGSSADVAADSRSRTTRAATRRSPPMRRSRSPRCRCGSDRRSRCRS